MGMRVGQQVCKQAGRGKKGGNIGEAPCSPDRALIRVLAVHWLVPLLVPHKAPEAWGTSSAIAVSKGHL